MRKIRRRKAWKAILRRKGRVDGEQTDMKNPSCHREREWKREGLCVCITESRRE